ncbi:MAG: hypothetical protein WD552_02665 [Candidatus Paceibacterota bacterium]
MNSLINFFKKNWPALLAGAGAALVIVSITVLTTKTDAISSVDPQPASVNSAVSFDKETESATNSVQVAGQQDTLQNNPNDGSDQTDNAQNQEPREPFDISVAAESVVVWDVQNHRPLFEKSADKERPLASVTKLMTALVGAQLAAETGVVETVISRQHLEALGESGLVAGQTWNIYDLISFMLMGSSNDAARAVAAAAGVDQNDGYAKDFIERMNDTAQSLGLEKTYFFNPSGLDLNETLISGGYGSARDIAQLFSYILETNKQILLPTTYSSKTFQSLEGVSYSAQNTNTWLSEFPEALGSKTGYTVLAGGNLVMAFDLERPIVIAVMGSTQTGRFQDMKTLYSATKRYLAEEAQSTTVSNLNTY